MSNHKPDQVAYRYVGTDGEHLSGIPTADLTYADLEMLSPLALRNLAHSPLYQLATVEAPKPDKTADGGKET